jgi:Flp pilus assembly protein TadG
MTTDRTRRRSRGRGQALVEFSIALIPFLLLLMGIADLGRGIYMSNGVSQAAREIARTTAVHLCATSGTCTLGNSAETADTVNTQKRLVPGLGDPASSITYTCTNILGATLASTACTGGTNYDGPVFVQVTVAVPYSALTPILSMVAPSTLSATAHIQLQ